VRIHSHHVLLNVPRLAVNQQPLIVDSSPLLSAMATASYRALPKLQIDGKDAPKELMEDILQLFVEESLHQPSMFTLVLRNDYQSGSNEKPWKHKDLLQIGKPVTVGFISSTTRASDFDEENKGDLVKGEITAIDVHFTEKTQAPIIIRGYDFSHRLHRGQYNRSFQNMTDTDIVKKIAKEAGIDVDGKTAEESGIPHDYLFQENQSNMDFLRERAVRIGFELFVQDGKLHFRKPKAGAQELSLRWLVDLRSFHVRMSSTEQVKEVEVRGWDYSQKRSIVATAKTDQVITTTENGKGSETSSKFNGKPTAPKMIVVDQPVFSPKEADRMAQALCDELGGQFVCADAKAEGNPKIRPGRVVKLTDMGTYSGKYYVTETRHVYQERLYTTEFSVRGLRGGMMAALSPPQRLQPGQTLMVGVVTDNEDPQGWGRVKVKFPTLTEEDTSNWARVVGLGAANQRGFDCLPEIEDEVLVAFEHGDIHRPYVIGGVWNGKDAPPNPVGDTVQNGKVRLRTFKTRTGHQIQFVEEDKGDRKAGVYIETKGGHQVQLTDSDKSIRISSTGNLKIEAKGNIDINATGIITVQGKLIKLN
jgi:phage protein D